MRHARTDRLRRRRGYGLAEVTLAVILLMAAMSLTVRSLAVAGRERREADRRLWATQAVANVMDRASAEPFEKLDAARVRALADAANAGRALPGAEWEVSVDEEKEPVAGKRVALRLRWNDRAGRRGAPVRLTAWVYRGRGGS